MSEARPYNVMQYVEKKYTVGCVFSFLTHSQTSYDSNGLA